MNKEKIINIMKEEQSSWLDIYEKKGYNYRCEDYINAYEEVINIVEKQIPKRPIFNKSFNVSKSVKINGYDCPNCGEMLLLYKNSHYCENCGQAIDWREL